MSRIAKYPVELPKGVEASIQQDQITVKGPLGSLTQALTGDVAVALDNGKLTFVAANETRHANAMSGTVRALVANMVNGVSKGFERKLTLVGVGYRASIQGDAVKLQLGFSHDVLHKLPAGIKAECPTQTEIVIKGSNKQVVGRWPLNSARTANPNPTRARACVTRTNASSSKKPRRNNGARKDESWTKSFPFASCGSDPPEDHRAARSSPLDFPLEPAHLRQHHFAGRRSRSGQRLDGGSRSACAAGWPNRPRRQQGRRHWLASAWPKRPRLPVSNWSLSIARAFVTMAA